MKARTLAVAFAAALTFAAVPPVLAAQSQAAHEHPAEGTLRLALNDGRKWATDEALRQGMGDIRAALDSKRSAIHGGSLSQAEYRALGQQLEAKLGFIVQNCKLPPAADANLHIVLGELQGATEALKKGSQPAAAQGAERAVAALNAYGKHFDHPGWQSL